MTTAGDGKNYNITYYALPMVIAVGFRVRSIRGTQFRRWANALRFSKHILRCKSRKIQ
ncbi:MAG: RhuM family protein [Treponema sp.]